MKLESCLSQRQAGRSEISFLVRGKMKRAWFLKVTLVLLSFSLVHSPSESTASLWLSLDSKQGKPGLVVKGKTQGRGSVSAVESGAHLPTFFVRQNADPPVDNIDDPRLVRIGALVIDRGGNGTIRFVVPQVPSGEYEVVVFCADCAAYSAGRTLLPVGTFKVIGAPGPSGPVENSSSTWVPIAGVLISVGAAGTFFLLRRRARLESQWRDSREAPAAARINAPHD